jgi:hypothetical protein
MDLKDFHITLINGEKIFQSKDVCFGVISSNGEFAGTTTQMSYLVNRNSCSAICICSSKGNGATIERIILINSILSFDKNTESLTRKIITEKKETNKTNE